MIQFWTYATIWRIWHKRWNRHLKTMPVEECIFPKCALLLKHVLHFLQEQIQKLTVGCTNWCWLTSKPRVLLVFQALDECFVSLLLKTELFTKSCFDRFIGNLADPLVVISARHVNIAKTQWPKKTVELWTKRDKRRCIENGDEILTLCELCSDQSLLKHRPPIFFWCHWIAAHLHA